MEKFYNTANETAIQAELFTEKNESQDEIVIGIFQNVKRPMGASDVFKRYPIANTPITSLRRAITNLSKEGFLMDTGYQKMGMYGKKEKLWQLAG